MHQVIRIYCLTVFCSELLPLETPSIKCTTGERGSCSYPLLLRRQLRGLPHLVCGAIETCRSFFTKLVQSFETNYGPAEGAYERGSSSCWKRTHSIRTQSAETPLTK